MNSDGTQLGYSTFIGGSQQDTASAIAVDSAGNAYVTGYTWSGNFPTVNAYQPLYAGSSDGRSSVFISKIAPPSQMGSATLVYSTYLGGSLGIRINNQGDVATGIAVDSNGHIYLAGSTPSSDFPTINAFQPVLGCPGGGNAFIETKSCRNWPFLSSVFKLPWWVVWRE